MRSRRLSDSWTRRLDRADVARRLRGRGDGGGARALGVDGSPVVAGGTAVTQDPNPIDITFRCPMRAEDFHCWHSQHTTPHYVRPRCCWCGEYQLTPLTVPGHGRYHPEALEP